MLCSMQFNWNCPEQLITHLWDMMLVTWGLLLNATKATEGSGSLSQGTTHCISNYGHMLSSEVEGKEEWILGEQKILKGINDGNRRSGYIVSRLERCHGQGQSSEYWRGVQRRKQNQMKDRRQHPGAARGLGKSGLNFSSFFFFSK